MSSMLYTNIQIWSSKFRGALRIPIKSSIGPINYHSNSYPLDAASSAIPKSCTQTYSFIPFVTNNSRPRQATLDTELNPSILNNSLPDDAFHTQTESLPLVTNLDASCLLCAMEVTGPSCEGENRCALRFIRCVESRGQCSIRTLDGVCWDMISLYYWRTEHNQQNKN